LLQREFNAMSHKTATRFVVVSIVWSAICLAGEAVLAQEAGLLLPADPASWVNSPPFTVEALQGKAVLLWFFEESCPRCREKWPELLATAAKYRDQPILFIGVNSGNARSSVAAYANQNRIDWPIIIDAGRQLEQQAGVGEISLRNIYQARVLTPDGRLQRADSSDLAGSADRALSGAKWNVDPADVPASLRSAWLAVEFNDFSASASAIKRAAGSRKAEEKATGEKLLAYVQQKIDADAAAAKQLDSAGQPWPAYQAYTALTQRFRGYDLPEGAAARLRELEGDDAVRTQLVAAKLLEAALKMAANPRTRSGAVSRLKTLVEQHPDSDAGREAQRILTQLNAP
jgi:thiol-disulfide isomerase/thioredoxin